MAKLRRSCFLVAVAAATLVSCRASAPGSAEARLVAEVKKETIGGKNLANPLPDTAETQQTGAEHFQHHCQICHGLDGHNSGVPFAAQMSPPVADLGDKSVQSYSDGQLKWIIQNGIRFTGMPGWSGILDENEQWAIIHYIRHLPTKGTLGPPPVFSEAEEQHHHAEEGATSGQEHEHSREQPHSQPEHRH
ncbi:MAG: c-type cytochrome [Terriglobales bacterium]